MATDPSRCPTSGFKVSARARELGQVYCIGCRRMVRVTEASKVEVHSRLAR